MQRERRVPLRVRPLGPLPFILRLPLSLLQVMPTGVSAQPRAQQQLKSICRKLLLEWANATLRGCYRRLTYLLPLICISNISLIITVCKLIVC